jgi:alpha-L-fucosidase
MTWFDTARFGLFVHWGHSSQQGIELSWPLVGGNFALPKCADVPVDAYHSSAATFCPAEWDARKFAALARRTGARYAVLTTKHHDGFSMWPTRQSDFSIASTPYRRDIVREFADALRAEGLRVGFYYSLIDWHHPDYPAFRDGDKPYRFDALPRPTAEQWERFTKFMFAQIRELLTEYGTVDLLWFDGHWERFPEQWKAVALTAMIRELQPDILINDRLPGAADFVTPEQFVPPQPPSERWETCLTMNDSWGYAPSDRDYKSATSLIHTLCEVAGRGGNLLLNVSPTGAGTLPPEQSERLAAIGGWMEKHSASIAGTTAGLEPWQFYGPSTRRDDTVYLHLLMKPYESVAVRGLPIKRVRSVQCLGAGIDLAFRTRCAILDQFANDDPLGEVTIDVPGDVLDPHATVLELRIAAR